MKCTVGDPKCARVKLFDVCKTCSWVLFVNQSARWKWPRLLQCNAMQREWAADLRCRHKQNARVELVAGYSWQMVTVVALLSDTMTTLQTSAEMKLHQKSVQYERVWRKHEQRYDVNKADVSEKDTGFTCHETKPPTRNAFFEDSPLRPRPLLIVLVEDVTLIISWTSIEQRGDATDYTAEQSNLNFNNDAKSK